MINMKKAILLSFALFLSGCDNSAKFDQKVFETQNKAVIFVNINTTQGSPVQTVITKSDGSKSYHLSTSSSDLGDYSPTALMIEPGIYYISKMKWYFGDSELTSGGTGLTNNGLIVYGGFIVYPGDVVTLGQATLQGAEGGFKRHFAIRLTSHTPNLEKLKRKLEQEGRHFLAERLKVGRVYRQGASIHSIK